MEAEKQNDELLLEKQYKIPFALFKESFIAFQRRFVYPRNYIVMGILFVVCCIYVYFVAYGDEANMPIYCMVILFCVVMIGFQWYNPRKIRRNLLEGVREIEDDEYRLRIYPEYLEIGTILPPDDEETAEADALFDDTPEEDFSGTRIFYNKGMHVIEYASFFMIYQKKTMFYVVPKAAFSEEETEILRVHFRQKLQGGFQSKVSS